MPLRRRPRPIRPDARGPFIAQTGRLPASSPRSDTGRDDALSARCFRLAFIMTALDQGIAFVDPDGRILEINDRYLLLLDRSREEMLGQGLAELGLESEDYQASAFLRLFRRGVAHSPVSFNQRLRNRDVTVKLQPVQEAGTFVGLIISFFDVTALVEARLSVEREKGYLEQVITVAGAAICLVNRDDVVVTINDEFTAITGYDRDQALGRPRLDLLRETPPSACPSQATPEDAARRRQSRIITHDGRTLTILKNAAPILDETGQATGGIESFVDITDLIRARQEAEETSRLKSAFLANMSHEIRTPLNSIMGLAQLLGRSVLTKEQRECVETIHASGEDLLVVLNDVLDFSRIESDRLTIRPVAVDMVRLTEELRRTIYPAAREKKLRLEIDRDSTLPRYLVCDPVRLKQILLNLLQNAVKFTDKGRVTLSLHCQNPPKTSMDRVAVRFMVQDTGCGISREMRERVFEPFVQAEEHASHNHTGTGLGLAIANRLVHMLGGSGLALTSREGQGSAFSFTLLLDQADASARPAPESEDNPESVALGRPRILVAEDNPFNRFLLQKILEKLDIPTPEFAVDGKQAVSMILKHQAAGNPFHLVFMDVRMPGMDGLEATRRVRKAGITIPIVALTAQASQGDAERCLQAGMTTYFPKPYSISDLEAVLTDLLPPFRSGDAS